MSATKIISDRTAALLEKQRELDERVKRSMQRDQLASRKTRNRGLLLIGVAIEKHIKRQPSYLATLRSFVSRLKDHEQVAVINFLDTLLAGDLAQNSTPKGDPPPITPPHGSQRSEAINPQRIG